MGEGGNSDFQGAKLALFIGARLLVIRRDDTPGLAWRGCLDFPGGGREGDESAVACVLRETREETGLHLRAADLVWRRFYPRAAVPAWFFAAHLAEHRSADIRFGGEGQGWCLMAPGAFLARADAVPHFQDRLREYLASGLI